MTALQALLTPLARVHGMDPREVFSYHTRVSNVLASVINDRPAPHSNSPDPERPLRVGYCSQDFRNRSAGHFAEPIITHHDKALYQVFLYHNTISEDELTTRLKSHAQVYRNVWGVDDKKMAEQIRKDGIDILVDLSGHTGCGRIVPFVVKPAPIQYTYMGYPNTTGLPQIDFRIVDWYTDPQGSEHLASETLVRMDGCFLCYTAPHHAGPVKPAPETANGSVTFGSFNTLTKVSKHVLEVWAKVLHAVPNSRLVLKALALSSPNTKDRIWSTLASFGIAKERVDLFAETKGKSEHLDTYAKVDIALDPWPYNGTTTTVEAMYMGVPVVSIAGNSHVSRVGVSLLTNLGTPELIAKDEADYVRIAADLAADRPKRLHLRDTLRSTVESSVLCDHAGFTRRLEAHYRSAWRVWCEKKKANPLL
jgi:predicted O-linked N-acetylglucosamine transferase (SPINDLY family)